MQVLASLILWAVGRLDARADSRRERRRTRRRNRAHRNALTAIR